MKNYQAKTRFQTQQNSDKTCVITKQHSGDSIFKDMLVTQNRISIVVLSE